MNVIYTTCRPGNSTRKNKKSREKKAIKVSNGHCTWMNIPHFNPAERNISINKLVRFIEQKVYCKMAVPNNLFVSRRPIKIHAFYIIPSQFKLCG